MGRPGGPVTASAIELADNVEDVPLSEGRVNSGLTGFFGKKIGVPHPFCAFAPHHFRDRQTPLSICPPFDGSSPDISPQRKITSSMSWF
ncbi:hypothetical protein Y032_0117g630 [Ancylostoma ceylanicum]|uniref:Uncharacterized protein n=1 Tax=Ancylostoma ceylanicum TaxID=53326 RepID=A0A016TBR5_9BILA|nr:hypothetical protein Y032_0117g630 [Ancylostoma ceylanicum]